MIEQKWSAYYARDMSLHGAFPDTDTVTITA